MVYTEKKFQRQVTVYLVPDMTSARLHHTLTLLTAL